MNFCNKKYRQQILKEMYNQTQSNSNNYDIFFNILKDALDGRALIKRKHLRSKSSPFMSEDISQCTMNRTRLRKKFLESRSFEYKAAYNE